MRVVLIAPTALDVLGRPIKQRRVRLPGLSMPMLAAVTPPDVQLDLVNETGPTPRRSHQPSSANRERQAPPPQRRPVDKPPPGETSLASDEYLEFWRYAHGFAVDQAG
jgi:hypothetical protein